MIQWCKCGEQMPLPSDLFFWASYIVYKRRTLGKSHSDDEKLGVGIGRIFCFVSSFVLTILDEMLRRCKGLCKGVSSNCVFLELFFWSIPWSGMMEVTSRFSISFCTNLYTVSLQLNLNLVQVACNFIQSFHSQIMILEFHKNQLIFFHHLSSLVVHNCMEPQVR